MSEFELYIHKKYLFYSLADVMYSDPMGPSFAVRLLKRSEITVFFYCLFFSKSKLRIGKPPAMNNDHFQLSQSTLVGLASAVFFRIKCTFR
jgi:hypothetical protein